jgi:hypothetical protein
MKTLALCLVMAVAVVSIAQPPDTLWTRTFGGSSYEKGNCVQQTNDGGFIVVGYTASYGAGGYDVWLIKTDSFGDTLWTRTFGGGTVDEGLSVQQTNDGGYIITGGTQSYGAGGYDVWLIKTDSNGDRLWTRTFGGTDTDEGNCVQQTNDGGYIITGYTNSYGAGSSDVWLIKTNSNGDSLWTNTFGGSGGDEGYSVQQTNDGGYIITGGTDSFGAGALDVWLIKTDSLGIQEWQRTFGVSHDEIGWSVRQTTDGGYIITARFFSSGAGGLDTWLIKTDSLGIRQWQRTFGGSDAEWGWSVQQTSDGGYIITGNTYSYGVGGSDVWLIKTDSNGDSLWTRTIGGNRDDVGLCIQQTDDGGYIITGYTESYGAGAWDVWLIRLESETSVVPNTNPSYPQELILHPAFPNPFNPTTNLTFDIPKASEVKINIYDIQGRKVTDLYSGWCSAGTYRTTFNATDLPSGIYFCRMEAGNFTQARKLLLLK